MYGYSTDILGHAIERGVWHGVRVLKPPKTVELLTVNDVGNLNTTRGRGFGLGFEPSTILDPRAATGGRIQLGLSRYW